MFVVNGNNDSLVQIKNNISSIYYLNSTVSLKLFSDVKYSSSTTLTPINPPTYAELLFTTKSNVGWVAGTAMPTGWVLFFILIIIELFSMPFIRQKGFFQVDFLNENINFYL